MRSVLALARVLILSCLPVAAPAQEDPAKTTFLVGTETVTQAEIDAVLASRRREFGADPVAAQELARKTLIAETAMLSQSRRVDLALAPGVQAALKDAQRQVLLQTYAQSTFAPQTPTEDDIAAYVAANARAFADRVTYRFHRGVIPAADDAARAAARALVADLQALPDPDEIRVEEAFATFAQTQLPFALTQIWQGSEALAPEMVDRLSGLAAEARWIDVAETDQGMDIVVLYAARPAPIDPALVHEQIVTRLLQEQFRRHRLTVIDDLAAPYLQPVSAAPDGPAAVADAPVATGPSPVSVRGLLALGVLAGTAMLVAGAALVWVRAAEAKTERWVQAGNPRQKLPILAGAGLAKAVGFVLTVVVVLAFGGLAWAVDASDKRALVVMIGGAALAVLVHWVLGQRRDITADGVAQRAGMIFLGLSALHVLMIVAALALR